MATAVSALSAISALDFDHTVHRGLVHRQSLSEVFLTDSRALADMDFVAGAQIPASHAYYTDHPAGPVVDALLLLECCRQAETHAAHAHFGMPESTKFVLRSWSFSFPGLTEAVQVPGPLEVVITAGTHGARRTGGALRALCYRMLVNVAGRYVGEVRMDVNYLPEQLYQAMRSKQHGGSLPSSEQCRADAHGAPVPPSRVARERPENVVLADAVAEGDAVRARLRLDGGHPSLFDHPQDHVPGMVLMEAGRQAALLAVASADVLGEAWYVTALDAAFEAYAELDFPLTVVARTPQRGATARDIRVPVAFEQRGGTTAQAVLTLTRR